MANELSDKQVGDPRLKFALAAAGLPSGFAATTGTMFDADNGDILGAYALDAEAIARVWVERRLAEMSGGTGKYVEIDGYNDAYGEPHRILAALFPEAPDGQ